ncbi:MptD family putative ECF transporter S component [Clostridium sp. BJN0001]|uniref:MptD family putative ECF transporter S component n=1 Tax=Clostridium sp. BJN0001 TaxID=2930219 RepID=UPI001FD1ABFF|nr:MptD family putative ECF transporter S component [Clostridium sp. BJN0001]
MNKKITTLFLIFLIVFSSIFSLSYKTVFGYENLISTDEGEKAKDDTIDVKKGYGIYKVNMDDEKFPSKAEWRWEGDGSAYACIKYSDNNVIYYLMGDSIAPEIKKSSFIDKKGIPRVIVPKILRVNDKDVRFNFLDSYYKYFGEKAVNVESITFYVKTDDRIIIKNLKLSSFKDRIPSDELVSLDEESDNIHIDINVPEGNSKDSYIIENEKTNIKITLRALITKESYGYLKIKIPNGMKIIPEKSDGFEYENDNVLKTKIHAYEGYYEKNFILSAESAVQGRLETEASLGNNVNSTFKDINCINLDDIKNNVSISDDGVYPVQSDKEKETLKKELKNNIKIKQSISDTFQSFIGRDEKYDAPAGYMCADINNAGEFDLPVHIKFSVLDDNGNEIKYFRGDQFDRQEGENDSVPETNVVLKSSDSLSLKLPVYADGFSVKPGTYKAQFKVSVYGSDTDILIKNFDLEVYKESQFQKIIAAVSIILSIICVIVFSSKQKKWLNNFITSEIMFIALFSAVKFVLVDVTDFVFSDSIRAILGPLGPVEHLITGILWDVVNSMFVTCMVCLIPKCGVIIISSVVRLILKGVAFGSFNPVSILLMMSYAVIAEVLLYAAGFTRGKRKFETKAGVFVLVGLIFGFQNCYSTYTFYYMWMYLYRLFYPSWYININAIFSIIYSIIGSIGGIYLSKKLKKVMD